MLQSAEPQPRHKVAVIGTGYVGAVTSTCLAFLGHSVCGLDSDSARAGQLNNGQTPFHEPGLPEMLEASLSTGRLRFTDSPAEALTDADFVFLCVGTPPGLDGAPDLSQLESAIQSLALYLRPGVVIVNKSTVPVGSGNWTRTILEDALEGNRELNFHVVSNPEFLREGCALDDFLYPDRIVLGGASMDVSRVAELYQPVLDQTFEGGRRNLQPSLITTELASAEMIKYAANAFLATKISFANEIAQMCEVFGADVREVIPAIGADHRVGSAFLNPGVGWGGSCFGKDVAALISSGEEYGYTPTMLRATVAINTAQRATVVRKLQRELHMLKGRRIALLGLTFKPGTDDLRDAPALDIAKRLIAAGALVSAFDPVVKSLPDEYAAIRLATDVYEATSRVDAVVLTTEWPEFRVIDPAGLRRVMRGDLVVDGRNVLPEASFVGAGLRLIGFGW
ncbi:UDP-glucose 6-dehydrogenase [Mycobacterium sp. ITM-2017-0098]|nr:UDP-glucose 6-dehydrogenase [Mycobacterium sp. ITM-2017-0098]